MWLSMLTNGIKAAIEEMAFEADTVRRLQAMGLSVGQEVAMIRQSHKHGPMMLRVGTSYLMVRHRDAQRIRIRPL